MLRIFVNNLLIWCISKCYRLCVDRPFAWRNITTVYIYKKMPWSEHRWSRVNLQYICKTLFWPQYCDRLLAQLTQYLFVYLFINGMPLEMYSIISFSRGSRESFPALKHISHSNILFKNIAAQRALQMFWPIEEWERLMSVHVYGRETFCSFF